MREQKTDYIVESMVNNNRIENRNPKGNYKSLVGVLLIIIIGVILALL